MYSRRYFVSILLIVITSNGVFADSASQADWSGESGISGPVFEWESNYDLSSDITSWVQLELGFFFMEHNLADDCNGVWSVFSEDIDGDGDMDILSAATVDDEIAWWENMNGSGTSWNKHIIEDNYNGARCVRSEDINGDGDMDVLGATGFHYGEITWWENSDAGSGIYWTEHPVDNYEYPRGVLSIDLNGDGYMDILGCGSDSLNHIAWWENIDGSGTSWTEHTIYAGSYFGVCTVFSEDIDGDGDLDVLGAEVWPIYTGYIRWFENTDGLGTSWSIHTVFMKVPVNDWSVYSGDVDNDGDMDIIGGITVETGEDILWWENTNGAGTSWTEHVVCDSFDGSTSVYLEDVDCDGDMDILGASYHCGIAWWENMNGSGTSWVQHTVDDNFDGARSVYCKDIDGNGILDIMGASSVINDLSWWEHIYTSEGSLQSSILDTNGDTDWDYIDWNATTPANTSVSFLLRASDDYTNMGSWPEDTLSSPCQLDGILNDGDRYLQYKTILLTSDPDTTPMLIDVTISWDPLSIEATEDVPIGAELLPIAPNPSEGSPVIRFGLAEAAVIRITIFDLAGRVIREFTGEEYTQGYHEVLPGDFSPGVYLCRMVSGDFEATERFVVIQ